MHFQKIEHIGLGAVDTSTLADWYCKIFNLHKISILDGRPPIYFLSDLHRSFIIEIFPVTALSEKAEKTVHLCFSVDNIHDAVKYLQSKKIETGERLELAKNGKTIFFTDPVNHTIQVVHRPVALWNEEQSE